MNINKLQSQQIIDLIGNLNDIFVSDTIKLSPDKVTLVRLGLGDAYTRIGKYDLAEENYSSAYTIAGEHNIIADKIRATNGLCVIKAIHSDYLKAIEGWQAIIPEVDDIKQKSDIYNNMGICYSMSDRNREALDCQYNCLKIDEELKRETQIAIDYFNLGSTYMRLKQFDKSLELYQTAIKTFEKDNELRYLAFAYSNISMVFTDIKKYDKALDYADRALEIKHKYANELEIAKTHANMGSLYQFKKDKAQALKYFDQSLKVFIKGDDPQSLAGLYIKYAHLYFDNKDYQQALDYSLKGFKIAKKNNSLQVIIEAGKMLSSIYTKKQDYKSAYQYQTLYIDAFNKIFEDNPKIMIAKAESEYYRVKTEEQAEFYRLSNIELTEKNRIISEQAELLNLANTKMQKTNTTLKKLLSVIAHDIRGPVSTSAQALSMITSKEFTPEEADEVISETAVSLQNTFHLLNELLTWTNNSQQETSVIMEPVDISKSILDDICLYQSMANLKSINISYVPKGECIVLVEKNFLHSILRNLIHNAIKFTPNKGHVSISIRTTKSKAYISIIDDGIGMTNFEIRRLVTGKAKVKQGTHFEMGSGFGIGLCLDYLAQMNSTLIVKSAPHQGSKFTVVLNRP
jgi:signal transduction histidine kinase